MEIDLDSIFPFFPKVSLPPALVCLPRDALNLSPTTFHLSELHWISASLSDVIPNQPGPGGVGSPHGGPEWGHTAWR